MGLVEPTNLLLIACALIYGLIGEPVDGLILLPVHIALLHLVIDPACTVVFEAHGPGESNRSAVFSLLLISSGGLVWLNGSGRGRILGLGLGIGLWALVLALPQLQLALMLAPLHGTQIFGVALASLAALLVAGLASRRPLYP